MTDDLPLRARGEPSRSLPTGQGLLGVPVRAVPRVLVASSAGGDRMRSVDLVWEPDEDAVADRAMVLIDRVREDDPATVFAEVQSLCQWHPAKAAQVLITLAAWINPEESTEALVRRVQSISASRINARRKAS